jgi:hypothetical protein
MPLLACAALPSAAGARRGCRGAARRCCVRASAAQSAGAAHPVGSKVKVVGDIVVYHVPKQKAGLALKGAVGVVEKHADVAPDGVSLLSCTQPLLVKFELPGADGGKPVSVLSHLTCAEVEAVAGGL